MAGSNYCSDSHSATPVHWRSRGEFREDTNGVVLPIDLILLRADQSLQAALAGTTWLAPTNI